MFSVGILASCTEPVGRVSCTVMQVSLNCIVLLAYVYDYAPNKHLHVLNKEKKCQVSSSKLCQHNNIFSTKTAIIIFGNNINVTDTNQSL